MQEKIKPNIFLDMDGVLCDWIGAAAELNNVNIFDREIRNKLKVPGTYINDIIGVEKMWERIKLAGSKFWSDLFIFPWSKPLYEGLCKLGKVTILSCPATMAPVEVCADAACGKIKWLRKHFDTNEFLLGRSKFLCASPNSVLVDDDPRQTKAFSEHGGNSFLFPNALSLLDKEHNIDDVLGRVFSYVESLEK